MSQPAAKLSLSTKLKGLIAKPEARGASLPAPPYALTRATLASIQEQAEAEPLHLGRDPWLILCAAAVCAYASPATLCQVYEYASSGLAVEGCVEVAAVSLTCTHGCDHGGG
jgi:hypothetical protein